MNIHTKQKNRHKQTETYSYKTQVLLNPTDYKTIVSIVAFICYFLRYFDTANFDFRLSNNWTKKSSGYMKLITIPQDKFKEKLFVIKYMDLMVVEH